MEPLIAKHFTAPGKFAINEAFEEHKKLILISREDIDKSFDKLNSVLNPQVKKVGNDYYNPNIQNKNIGIKYNRMQNK